MRDKQINDGDVVVAEAAGWPLWLVHLSDLLSDGLPAGEREQFHADLRQAVPAGVDLDPIKYRIAIARHERGIAHLAGNTAPYAKQCVDALKEVIEWCQAEISGTSSEELRSAAWEAAVSAAMAAARAAEWAAAEWEARLAMAAARAAEWAAKSVWSAAESASWSAEWSAEESAVHAEYQAERDALLSALRNMQRTSGGDHD